MIPAALITSSMRESAQQRRLAAVGFAADAPSTAAKLEREAAALDRHATLIDAGQPLDTVVR